MLFQSNTNDTNTIIQKQIPIMLHFFSDMVKSLKLFHSQLFQDCLRAKKEYIIITNIAGLLLDTIDLQTAIKKSGSVEVFFTPKVQESVTKKYQAQGKKLVYIIDEAQQYFHRRFYEREVFSFFESHRHFGLDIYLLTQNSNLLAKDLLALAEIEIRAVPRTLSIGGFYYLKKSNREIIGRQFLRKLK